MALTTNLDHYWKCDEASNADRADSIGSWTMTDVNAAPAATGKVYANAIDFASGGEALSQAGQSLGGDVDRTLEVWVKLSSKSATQTFVSKGLSGGDRAFVLNYDQPSDRFVFLAWSGAGATGGHTASADNFGSPTTGVWYHIRAYHDAAGDVLGIQVNNGTANTVSHTGGFYSETNEFDFGFTDGLGNNFTGVMGPVALWSKLLSADEKAQTYNGGAGLTLAQMQRSPFGLAIWELGAVVTPAVAQVLACVDTPGGTPASKKFTISELIAALVVSNVVVQVLSAASGTYTPTSGMKKVLAIGVGGGGGGDAGLATDSAGGGGGGGGTCIRLLSAADIGSSKAYAVGAAGLGRTSTQASTAGGATTLDAAGALLNAGGGQPGTAGAQGGTIGSVDGGAGGSAANGDLNIPGTPGRHGVVYSGTAGWGGRGGSSVFGFGGAGGRSAAGTVGTSYGGGGGGGHAATAADRNGADGAAGVLFMLEFV